MCRVEQIGAATLYLGDCRELLPSLSADAVISDPPYGINYIRGRKNKTGVYRGANAMVRQNKFAGTAIRGDGAPFDPAPLLRFGNVLLWGADHYRDRLPPSGRFLAWDKLAGKPNWDDFSHAYPVVAHRS